VKLSTLVGVLLAGLALAGGPAAAAPAAAAPHPTGLAAPGEKEIAMELVSSAENSTLD
jgi:hypothetical protein